MKRPTLLTTAVWLALAGHARAETSADTATREFERIQVTATRSEDRSRPEVSMWSRPKYIVGTPLKMASLAARRSTNRSPNTAAPVR